MRISKSYLVVCAAALGVSVVTIRAADNPAQAAALAALEAKMRELGAQPIPTNTPTSAPATPERPAPARIPAPAAPSSDHGLFAPAPPPSGSSPAVAAMPTMQPSPTAQTTPAATATTSSTSTAVAPVRTSAPTAPSSDRGLFAPVPPSSGSSPGLTELQAVQPPPNLHAAPPAARHKPGAPGLPPSPSALAAGGGWGLKPITAPPPPISVTQQTQLQALLQKYDANAVTPEQYQVERAKILAER